MLLLGMFPAADYHVGTGRVRRPRWFDATIDKWLAAQQNNAK
jgi:hypothetical protein